jgi:hypothetical protein
LLFVEKVAGMITVSDADHYELAKVLTNVCHDLSARPNA